MKLSSVFIFFSLFIATVQAQSLQVHSTSSTSSNSTDEFNVGENTIGITSSSLVFDAQSMNIISADIEKGGMTAVVNQSGVSILDEGKKISTTDYQIKGNDASLKIYVKGDGSFVIRENIANFLVFDSFGKIKHSVSNSSQSTEGEAISELAFDPYFKTVLFYNPKIIMNGEEGSRVKLLKKKGTTTDIFNSRDRAIRTVKISNNGEFVAIATYRSGTDDEVTLTDLFGNILNKISFDQDISGVQITEDGKYLTVYSTGRIAVYSVLSGERIGSTSVRGASVRFASYIPQDQTIVAVSGDKEGDIYSNVEVRAVNIKARKIASGEYGQSLGATNLIDVEIERKSKFNYQINGLSKSLDIEVSF